MHFAIPTDNKKNKRKLKKDRYPDLARELKKGKNEGDGNINCNWRPWYTNQKIGKGTGRLESKRALKTIQLQH